MTFRVVPTHLFESVIEVPDSIASSNEAIVVEIVSAPFAEPDGAKAAYEALLTSSGEHGPNFSPEWLVGPQGGQNVVDDLLRLARSAPGLARLRAELAAPRVVVDASPPVVTALEEVITTASVGAAATSEEWMIALVVGSCVVLVRAARLVVDSIGGGHATVIGNRLAEWLEPRPVESNHGHGHGHRHSH